VRRVRDIDGDKEQRLTSPLTVGANTFFTAGFGHRALSDLKTREVERQMALAKAAYEAGELSGLTNAIDLLKTHRADAAWPPWVQEATASELQRALRVDDVVSAKGRHAQRSTRRRDDLCDLYRATYVDCAMIVDQLTKTRACREVSSFLGGDPGGSEKVMMDAHKRFHARVRSSPERYYPFMDWRAQMLFAAIGMTLSGEPHDK